MCERLERLGGVSRACRPLRRSRGEPPCGPFEGCVCIQRGVGVEVCPAEPPLDLENEGVCVKD